MNAASLFLMQAAVGVFFAISGYHKLFNKARHASLVATLEADKVPLVKVNQWWVPSVEMCGGAALAVGFFAEVAAAFLLVICAVAVVVDGSKRVAEWKPIDVADWLDDYLYLPEVLLAVMLVAVMVG